MKLGYIGHIGATDFTKQDVVKYLDSLTPEQLALVASGKDPEGGEVPAAFKDAALARVRAAKLSDQTFKDGYKFAIKVALVGGGLWWLSRRGSK